jgi:hypothetical protein
VLQTLEVLLADPTDAEAEQRGYLITVEEPSLEPITAPPQRFINISWLSVHEPLTIPTTSSGNGEHHTGQCAERCRYKAG